MPAYRRSGRPPIAARAPWVDPAAYAGTYEVAALGQRVEVFADIRGLWVRIGKGLRQLFPILPHRFVTTQKAKIDFNLAGGVATGFTLELPDGRTAEAVRVEQKSPGPSSTTSH